MLLYKINMFFIPFLPLIPCCCSSMIILCLFGNKIFGAEKMNMIWSVFSSSSSLMMICCIVALLGTLWMGSKVVETAGKSFDAL